MLHNLPTGAESYIFNLHKNGYENSKKGYETCGK